MKIIKPIFFTKNTFIENLSQSRLSLTTSRYCPNCYVLGLFVKVSKIRLKTVLKHFRLYDPKCF